MAVTLNKNTDCCESTCTNTTVNVAGPTGPAGAAGTNGTNGSAGINAYARTSQNFVVLDVGAVVALTVNNATPFMTGMIIFIQDAGYYEVVSTTTNTINAKNLGYAGNAAKDTAIGNPRLIVSAGIKGADGANGSLDVSGFTNAGDIITRNASSQTVLSVDSSIDSTKALFQDNSANKIIWKKVAASGLDGNISLTSQVSGSLPLANVGNGLTSAAAGDVLYWTGTAWARVAAPTSADQLLGYNTGTNAPNWVSPSTSGLVFAKGTVTASGLGTIATDGITGAVNIGSTSTITGTNNRWRLNFQTPSQSTDYTVLLTNSNPNKVDEVLRVHEKEEDYFEIAPNRTFSGVGVGFIFDFVVYQ
tara:strand:- start:2305 stop:3387 length:1083 start_codon:yes stop_codon:yes gene_type:complete